MVTSRSSLPLGALFVLTGLMLAIAVSSASREPAGASEAGPAAIARPALSVLAGCEDGAFHYRVLLFEHGDAGTDFTVASRVGAAPAVVETHHVAPGERVALDAVVPDGAAAAFHVTNHDDARIDDRRLPTARCTIE